MKFFFSCSACTVVINDVGEGLDGANTGRSVSEDYIPHNMWMDSRQLYTNVAVRLARLPAAGIFADWCAHLYAKGPSTLPFFFGYSAGCVERNRDKKE